MIKKSNLVRLVACTAISVALTAGCQQSAPAAAPPASQPSADKAPAQAAAPAGAAIKLGVDAVMTGGSADVGFHCSNGAQMAIDEINAAGGVVPAGEQAARKLELAVADDQGTPAAGINAITKLINDDKVFAFAGPDFSGVTAPSSYLSKDAKVIQLTSSLASAITQQGNEWLFRTRANDKVYAATTAKFIMDELKPKTVALSNTNNELGLSGIQEIERVLKETYKVDPVVKVSHGVGDKDLSAPAARIAQANPDVLVQWGLQAETALLIRDLRNLGWKGKMIFQTADPIFVGLAKEYSEGVIGPQNWIHTATDAASKEFTDKYTKKYGKVPTQHSPLYYDAMKMVTDGIKQVGLDRNKVREYLINLNGYKGISGIYKPAALGKTGDMSEAIVMAEIQKEQPVELKKYGY